jgi:hypothetical protein
VIVFDGRRWWGSFFLLQSIANVRGQRLDAAQQFVALVEVVMNVVQIAFDAVQCFCTAINGRLGTEARRFSSTRVRTSLLREFDEGVA